MAAAGDLALDLSQRLSGTGRRLDDLAARSPRRRVLVLSAYRPGTDLLPAAARALRESRHAVRLALGSTGDPHPMLAGETVAAGLSGGKFQNLNEVWSVAGGADEDADWTLVVDDDVDLPARFLDRLLGLCERFELILAQPAQTLRSHAAWRVTRRRAGSVLRETRFVEIGPVTAFRREAAEALIPFPDLRFGWGLDVHWAAVAAERGWRLGIVDAVPVRHDQSPVATAYRADEAIEEARRFLESRPYIGRAEAQQTLAVHRRVPR